MHKKKITPKTKEALIRIQQQGHIVALASGRPTPGMVPVAFGEQLEIYRSSDYFIEVMPKGMDKAASIKVLIEKLGIARENTIACGDGFNDLAMIRFVGVGVAMENAVDAVKAEADYITGSNNHDGIVQVIEKFM